MVNNSVNKKSVEKCFQCGSDLIYVSEETVRPEGARYPQTNIIYRCSNVECQNKKDKEKTDRLKLKQNRAVIEQERIERIQETRKQKRKSITIEN